MGKNIFIVTHYYNSVNFGGNLQSYALPHFLNKHGYNAKQICYDVSKGTSGVSESLTQKIIRKLKHDPLGLFIAPFRRIVWKVLDRLRAADLATLADIKRNKMLAFNNFQHNIIPHTDKEYIDTNLKNLNTNADFFITGSDQVFNYHFYKFGYWLTFATKPKFSYAGSMALNEIPEDKVQFTKDALKDFKAIGVREERTQELYSDLLGRNVELNLDPTFLLGQEDWDEVASPRLIEEPYVCCYFLGSNEKERLLAKEYAKKNKLKLACIPLYQTRYAYPDMEYGDINLPYASPEDFISLLKYSEAVFTDSFHTCVFSMIYNKEYVVFNRDSSGAMSSRIVSLMKLLHTEERFLDTDDKCTLVKVEKVLNGQTEYKSKEFDDLKAKSIKFLQGNIED